MIELALQDKLTSESFILVRQMGDGTVKAGAPRLGFGVIDVGDLAAGFLPEANGRHIVSAHESDVFSMSQELTENFGGYPFPNFAFPKWLVWLVGPLANLYPGTSMSCSGQTIPRTSANAA
ncbi:hypothetical protein [Ruegeria atlantica]|uniref:hypothetical protein n=1 Tax=Ruegeria atlantica TaxID=81569 RepID=UPI002493E94E|nr:hypothetical protein [Ruegeria atlantica]